MNKYLQLLLSNKGLGEFKAQPVTDDRTATVYLYDTIVNSELEAEYFGGVEPKLFAQTLAGIKADTINLRVNSPGGSVFAARAMAQAIKEHPARVIAHVDGLAASAASFLVMAADEIVMGEGSFLMIHNAWTVSIGNAADMRREADLLDTIDESLVKTYAKRTTMPKSQIREMMAAETWINAEEAVQTGFANRAVENTLQSAQPQAEAAPAASFDLSTYDNPPDTDPMVENANELRKRRIALAKRALMVRRTD